MKISIIGTGYVGLVTGVCFADTGIDVICVDVDKNKIDKLNEGILPIYEPGLKEILDRNVKNDRLKFSNEITTSLKDSEVVFIAVGTPSDVDGSADLKYVLAVAKDIGKHIENYTVIVTKSTVPVGTAKKVKDAVNRELKERGADVDFDIVSNPEFLKEGAAVNDFLRPDRIVVGLESSKAEETMKKLYKPFVLNGHPVIFMDVASAEMTKYAANSMLATRISFINEISSLCEAVGANVNMVRKGIGSDTRIGPKFLFPGIGYGGSCFPKDVKALIKTAKENNSSMQILESVEKVNDIQKSLLFKKANAFFNNDLKGKTIALWGLSFKPRTDDMRDAPSLVIIDKLLEAGCKVKGYDPQAMDEAKKVLENKIEFADDQYEALIDADCLMIITEWQEFLTPNYKVMTRLMKQRVILDGRNIYDAEELKKIGFEYVGIGV